MQNDTPVIGWREWVELTELGCGKIKVKGDTGARSSALHAFNVKEFEKDGETWVKFDVHPDQDSGKRTISTKAKVLEYRKVKNSGGKATMRPVIVTTISLMAEVWEVELTLANRDEMGFRMLLGRQAIRGRFLVDTGNSFYGGKPKGKKKKTAKSAL
jgi:hypothetical protein